MIISHKHKFIFLKTRKTAGSSFENFMYPKLGLDDICTGSPRDGTPRINHPTEDGHVSWKYFHLNYNEEFNNYFTFCVERNPWDKVVSYYYWYKKIKPHKVRHGFEEFVLNEKFSQQNDWKKYADSTGVKVDKVLRYESLHKELQTIPIPYASEMLTTHVKSDTRKNRSYRPLYNTETKNTVARVFKDVINQFGYEF